MISDPLRDRIYFLALGTTDQTPYDALSAVLDLCESDEAATLYVSGFGHQGGMVFVGDVRAVIAAALGVSGDE